MYSSIPMYLSHRPISLFLFSFTYELVYHSLYHRPSFLFLLSFIYELIFHSLSSYLLLFFNFFFFFFPLSPFGDGVVAVIDKVSEQRRW
ncbi:hypothetical protein LOK49_LG11G01469 [Camellia lanceoleosa]|uniref:Uncharacterized protein n=1 Tax=Camellia lanceoleosa TaxID=1840588 RepID=A0ACC0G403_9ERIC|nr:hypothetical protein LOK49_LG11G01469 [Camellia lanceoleosa]